MEIRERRRSDNNRKKASRKENREEVVYTQPEPFQKKRFLLRLVTVVAVVLALIFGLSIFFKVDKQRILVSFKDEAGNVLREDSDHKYKEIDVVEAAGIQHGDNLLSISETEISGRILERLPYITQVRVGIKLPDTVNIEVVETNVTYAIEAADGSWWLVRSDGIVLEKTTAADAEQTTMILGVKAAAPEAGLQVKAFQPENTEETPDQTEQPKVSASDQLDAALHILQCLEENRIIGNAASVDVTNLSGITLWYEDRYDVYLGDNTQLSYKISSMKAAIDAMKPYQRGKLDVSFMIKIEDKNDQVIYTPFE